MARLPLRAESIVAGAMSTIVAAAAFAVACAPSSRTGPATARPTSGVQQAMSSGATRGELHGRLDGIDRYARIALATGVTVAPISSTTRWRVDEQGGTQPLVKGSGTEPWRIERKGGLLRIAGEGDDATPWRQGPFVVRTTATDGMLQYNGHRYRGELWFTATDVGILVVNRIAVEDYLKGVVPTELGTRLATDRAAMEAQAIAARSYAYMRVPSAEAVQSRGAYDMVATVQNQVYLGADTEHPVVNQAVDATAGLVLRYGGLLVDAPYSASCGGRSAVPTDAWRDARSQPYLQAVDDLDPASGKPFCDLSPRNHWTAELDETRLNEAVRRALVATGANAPEPTVVREVKVAERTASGRVGELLLRTERGDVRIRANDVRAVLRDVRGAILFSTYFSIDREARNHGHLTGITLRGAGNGHGVGMCQWGAIGRARAGQDARTILAHYYPGTVVSFAD